MIDYNFTIDLIPCRTDKHTSTDINYYLKEVDDTIKEYVTERDEYEIEAVEGRIVMRYYSYSLHDCFEFPNWLFEKLNGNDGLPEYIIHLYRSDDYMQFPYVDAISGKDCIAVGYHGECMNAPDAITYWKQEQEKQKKK